MSKPRVPADVVILGAGLTGLAAATRLRGGYRLLEAEGRVGGLCATTEDEGYRFDRTGHLFHSRDEEIRRWIETILEGRLVSIERRSRIFSHGVYSRFPFQANTFGLPPAVAFECLKGFLDAWERRDGYERPPRDFEDYIRRYFGDGIAKHFMIPYNTKLWGVPPREMSTAWTQRFVPRPTRDDVLAGAVGLNDRELGYNAAFLYPKKGIGELPQAIHRGLAIPAELGMDVVGIDVRRRTVITKRGEVPYRRLISTMPLIRLGSRLMGAPKWVVDVACRLRWTSLTYLDVALDRRPGTDYHWSYVPEKRFPFYRVGAYSNFSEALAPRGKGSLYVELASRGEFRRSRLPGILRGLRELGIIRDEGDVRFVRARRIPFAYVIYDRAWDRTRARLHAFLEAHGIRSCGRYGSWEYSAMEDALLAGRDAARWAKESEG